MSFPWAELTPNNKICTFKSVIFPGVFRLVDFINSWYQAHALTIICIIFSLRQLECFTRWSCDVRYCWQVQGYLEVQTAGVTPQLRRSLSIQPGIQNCPDSHRKVKWSSENYQYWFMHFLSFAVYSRYCHQLSQVVNNLSSCKTNFQKTLQFKPLVTTAFTLLVHVPPYTQNVFIITNFRHSFVVEVAYFKSS